MQSRRLIKTFTDRYPFFGPAIWMVAVQYFIIQVIVARAWQTPYSLTHNTISDLGNTACGTYTGRLVCSPLHGLMNASFIALGITMALGAGLIYQEFKENTGTLVGFSFMGAAGIGTLLVGLFPENTIGVLHIIGAALPFIIGNLGMVILSFSLSVSKSLRYYTFFSGSIALVALIFFITHHYLGFGAGGMERITSYPQTIWLIVFGGYISSNHIRLRSANN